MTRRSGLLIVVFILLSLSTPTGAEDKLQAVLKIPGSSDADGLKITTTSSDFQRPFFVESMNNIPVSDLRIFVADFIGPDSQLVETGWTVNRKPGATTTVSLPGLESVMLVITARLPQEGIYSGSISLIHNQKRRTIPLVVTRSRQAPTIKLREPEASRALSFWTADADLWMTIEETGGLKWTLYVPQLMALALKQGDKSRIQARFERVNILTDTGDPVTNTLAIEPNQARRLRIRISNLCDTGEITGIVRVGSADFAPVEQTFTIFIKKSWGVAAFLIFIGVLCSYLLKLYYKRDRPRMLLARRALLLSGDVESIEARLRDLTEGEKAVLDSLRICLQNLYEDVEAGVVANADAVLVEVDGKLSIYPSWVNARRRIEAVQPPSIVVALRQKLEDIAGKLTAKGATAQDIDKLRTDLVELDTEITDAVREEFIRRLDEFLADVDKQAKSGSPTQADRLAADVVPKIAAAKDTASSNDIVVASSQFDEARTLYARLLAEELDIALASDPAPPGILKADWDTVVTNVGQHTAKVRLAADADDAIEAYQAGYSIYLKKLIGALHKRAEDSNLIIEAIKTLTQEDKNLFYQRLEAIVQKLDSATRKLQVTQLRGAASNYTKAKQDMEEVAKSVKQAAPGTRMSKVPNDDIADAQPGGTIPTSACELRAEQAAQRTAWIKSTISELSRSMVCRDRIFACVILFISVLLGLKLLWADDPTWGGAKAYLTAVLWGLGLHQVSGTAFEGAQGLMEKWSK